MLNKISVTWVLALMVITHVSCKKDTGSVGLQPGDDDDNLIHLDTFTLITRTVEEDSFRVSSPFVSYQMVGATQSNEYGYNAAATWVSFSLPNSNFSFPAGVTVDSVVLQMKYLNESQYAGNLNTPMNYRVSQVTERMYSDSLYYSDKEFSTIVPFTNNGVLNDLSDSVVLVENGVTNTYAPHLRLRVSQDVEDVMENATATDLASNENFQNYFNGLKIDVEGQTLTDGQGNVVLLDLQNSLSGLAVYFNDTGKYVFPIGSGMRMSTFTNDYSSTNAVLNQLNAAQGTDFTETYMQSLAGLKTRIETPGLLELLNSGTYAVVNAELQVHFDDANTSDDFPAPNRILLLKRDSSGRNAFVKDQLEEPNLYGGLLNETEHRYTFNLSREVQEILNTYRLEGLNTNTGFYLIIPSDNPVSATRLKLDMNKSGNRGVKLKITLIKSD